MKSTSNPSRTIVESVEEAHPLKDLDNQFGWSNQCLVHVGVGL